MTSEPPPAHPPAQATPPYSVTSVVADADVASLEADWNRLSDTEASPNVFMTCDWFRAWNQCLSREDPRRRPHVLVLRQNERVMGLSPFILRTCSRFGFAVRKIEFVASQGDYHDFVLGGDPQGQIGAVARFLAQTSDEWDLVELTDLREAGGQIPRIESALSRAHLSYRILPEQKGCPYVTLEADPSTPMNNLSGHVRRTLRKRIERASALGLRVRIIENPQQEPGLVDEMIGLERGKIDAGGPFIGKYPEVFRSLFDGLGPRGWLYVALLEREDRPVAFQLGFRCGHKLWDYSKSYDRSCSRFAPGTILVQALLAHGASRGYDEYDFLRGEEPYKTVWSTGCHRSYRLLIWNRRWVSRVRKFIYRDLKTPLYRLFSERA